MKYLVDWEFYSSLFPNSEITPEEFHDLIPEAQAKLETWTSHRITSEMIDFKVNQIKQTLCFMVNAMHKAPRVIGVESVSNDGYSEKYATNSAIENEIKAIAFDGLSGTGLMGYW